MDPLRGWGIRSTETVVQAFQRWFNDGAVICAAKPGKVKITNNH